MQFLESLDFTQVLPFDRNLVEFCQSICHSFQVSANELFRIVISDSRNVYLFSVTSKIDESVAMTTIIRIGVNHDENDVNMEQVLSLARQLITNNYPMMNAGKVLEDNYLFEVSYKVEMLSNDHGNLETKTISLKNLETGRKIIIPNIPDKSSINSLKGVLVPVPKSPTCKF